MRICIQYKLRSSLCYAYAHLYTNQHSTREQRASSTFTGNSIVFNIHHGRAQEARKKLKRRRSSHAALIDSD